MVEPLPKAVLEAADVSAVSQLILRERVSRDLGLWEQMRDCYHDDSAVRISWINASGPELALLRQPVRQRLADQQEELVDPDVRRQPALTDGRRIERLDAPREEAVEKRQPVNSLSLRLVAAPTR